MTERINQTPNVCPDFRGTWGKKGTCLAVLRFDRQFGGHHDHACSPNNQISFADYHEASPTEGLQTPGVVLLRPFSNTNTSQYENEVTKTGCPRVDRQTAFQKRKLNPNST